MKHTSTFTMSPLQCRVLSLVAEIGGQSGVSCTRLAVFAHISRPVLYVLVRRLAFKKWLRRRRVRVPGGNSMQVLYAVTATGLKARERYAAELHLNPY